MFFHVDTFYMMLTAAPDPLSVFFFFFLPWPQLAAFGKTGATVKSEPLSANALFYLA